MLLEKEKLINTITVTPQLPQTHPFTHQLHAGLAPNPPTVTEICCHPQDLVCSRARSHLPLTRSSESQLFPLTADFTLISLLCCHPSQLSGRVLGVWGSWFWHSRAKSFEPSLQRSCPSPAERLLGAAQNCFIYWDKRDYCSQRCKGIKYTFPKEETINNIPSIT